MHSMGWQPHVIPISQGGSVKSLGVRYDLDLSGRTQRELSTRELKGLLAACRHRVASPDTIKAVLVSSVLNKIAYRGCTLAGLWPSLWTMTVSWPKNIGAALST